MCGKNEGVGAQAGAPGSLEEASPLVGGDKFAASPIDQRRDGIQLTGILRLRISIVTRVVFAGGSHRRTLADPVVGNWRIEENDMSSNRRVAAALVVAAGMSCGAQIAVADESGSFTAIASMIRNYTTIEHAGGTIIGGVSEGTYTVLESSGGPFVAGEHSQVTCVIHGKRSAAGIDLVSPCTSTTAAGDKSYLVSKRSAGDVEEGGGGIGSLELVGGTGIYAGVTGTCTYQTDYLANDRFVTMTDCTWQRSAE